MTLDSRWKNPQGKTPEQLHDAIVQIVRELRKGDFLPDTPDAEDIAYDNATSGLAADNVQDAIDEVEGRVDDLEALPAAGLVLLASGTVTNQATLDIPLTGHTAYRAVKVLLTSILPVTDDADLFLRFSSDGGSNFDATGYAYSGMGLRDNGTGADVVSGSANQIALTNVAATNGVSNAAAEGGVDGEVTLHGRTDGGRWTRARYHVGYVNTQGTPETVTVVGAAVRETAQDTDAIRFLFDGGNIASGSWALYGLT